MTALDRLQHHPDAVNFIDCAAQAWHAIRLCCQASFAASLCIQSHGNRQPLSTVHVERRSDQ